VKDARSRLRKSEDRKLRSKRVIDELSSGGRWTLAVVSAFPLLALIGCWLLNSHYPRFGLSFEPNSGSVLQVMWQVQAALVALGFPFLLLLIQLARDGTVTATRTSEVLSRSSHVLPAMEFGAVGLAVLGVIVAWFDSDPAVFLGTFFILMPTLVWLGVCYIRSFRILLDAPRLQRLSQLRLESKLRESMTALWAMRHGGEILFERIGKLRSESGIRVEVAYSEPDDDSLWWNVPAPESGWVSDINSAGLASFLKGLPARPAADGLDSTARTDVAATTAGPISTTDVLLRCSIGDKVRAGSILLSLRKESFALESAPTIPVDRIFDLKGSSRE
jgi:hypothetical protein